MICKSATWWFQTSASWIRISRELSSSMPYVEGFKMGGASRTERSVRLNTRSNSMPIARWVPSVMLMTDKFCTRVALNAPAEDHRVVDVDARIGLRVEHEARGLVRTVENLEPRTVVCRRLVAVEVRHFPDGSVAKVDRVAAVVVVEGDADVVQAHRRVLGESHVAPDQDAVVPDRK